MPKYRLLTTDELHNLEKEFVNYLIINGINKDEWIQIKERNKTKAEGITELFSDVVFEKIMRKTEYLLKIEKSKIFAFKCATQQVELVTIETEDITYDFSQKGGLLMLKENPPSDLKGYKATKKYTDIRENEIFNLIENGCSITDDKWFTAISKLL